MSSSSRFISYLLPMVLLIGLGLVFYPVPPALMDLLVTANLTLAVLVLVTSFMVDRPLSFNVFPALLVVTTMARLSLNIASTRMILTDAATAGTEAAGRVIAAFGQHVAGDQLIVGLALFAILVLVQLLVITHGTARISEVAARFTLDGLPGRQMTIDADLNSGAIDNQEARRQRQELTRQADFFGAMDGASKFLRGDAMASLVIIGVNLGGGLFRGVVEGGMSLSRAIDVYSKLTIGDGLASQVPALLISIAASILIARCSERSDFSVDVVQQMFANRGTLVVAAGFLLLVGLGGLPFLPLACVAAALLWAARWNSPAEAESTTRKDASVRPSPTSRRPEALVEFDPIELELGLQLLPLARPGTTPDLLSRLTAMRQRIAGELGLIVPRIRVRDNLQLAPHEFCLKIMGNEICREQLHPQQVLAVAPTPVTTPLRGRPARGLVSRFPQWWIDAGTVNQARAEGYRILPPLEALVAAMGRALERHADELLTRDAVQSLLDTARQTVPVVVDALVSSSVSLARVQKVLQALVRDRIPLKQLPRILEALCDFSRGMHRRVQADRSGPHAYRGLHIGGVSRSRSAAADCAILQ